MGMHLLAFNLALYVGPDQLLPLTSVLGAIGGALMIFWRHIVGFTRKFLALFSKRQTS